jgi:hypothetical protein
MRTMVWTIGATGTRVSRAVGLLVIASLMLMVLTACGAPDAADADATFYAQQTIVAGNRPPPTASPAASPTEQPEPTPTVTEAAVPAEGDGTETPSVEAEPPTATVAATELPVTLTGTGVDVSEAVTLGAGVLVAQLSHDGSGTFAVSLLDSSGAEVAELADGTGAWNGTRAILIPAAGEYVAEVTASGDWEIVLDTRDPGSSAISILPFAQSGQGSQAVYFVRITPGEHTLHAIHDGDADFVVSVLSSDGSYFDEVISTSGVTDTSDTFTVPEPVEGTSTDGNVYLLLDIRANGNWEVGIQ